MRSPPGRRLGPPRRRPGLLAPLGPPASPPDAARLSTPTERASPPNAARRPTRTPTARKFCAAGAGGREGGQGGGREGRRRDGGAEREPRIASVAAHRSPPQPTTALRPETTAHQSPPEPYALSAPPTTAHHSPPQPTTAHHSPTPPRCCPPGAATTRDVSGGSLRGAAVAALRPGLPTRVLSGRPDRTGGNGTRPAGVRRQIGRYMYRPRSLSSTYDHRSQRTEDPVRSPELKLRTGGLVVRWVTTCEYPLLYVLPFCPPWAPPGRPCLLGLLGLLDLLGRRSSSLPSGPGGDPDAACPHGPPSSWRPTPPISWVASRGGVRQLPAGTAPSRCE